MRNIKEPKIWQETAEQVYEKTKNDRTRFQCYYSSLLTDIKYESKMPLRTGSETLCDVTSNMLDEWLEHSCFHYRGLETQIFCDYTQSLWENNGSISLKQTTTAAFHILMIPVSTVMFYSAVQTTSLNEHRRLS